MNIESFDKTTAITSNALYCTGCDEEVFFCDKCKDCFEENDTIYCENQLTNNKNKHFCWRCVDEMFKAEGKIRVW